MSNELAELIIDQALDMEYEDDRLEEFDEETEELLREAVASLDRETADAALIEKVDRLWK